MEFLNNFSIFEKVMFWMAVPSTVILVFQSVFTFIGMENYNNDLPEIGDSASPADYSMSHFPVLTIKNVIIFFSIFGWTGLAMKKAGAGDMVTIAVAIVAAIVVILLLTYMFYFINKLSEDNTLDVINAIGATGTVYLKIPAEMKGRGKVQAIFQGAQREIDAVTRGEELETGTMIKITEIIEETLVVVEKI